MTFTGGMRSISAGSVLATTYFPAAVTVPVVLGMLFQQMLASFFGFILEKHSTVVRKKGDSVKDYFLSIPFPFHLISNYNRLVELINMIIHEK
ncbi:hypothetical protein [Peribacillus sp. CSMR9]|uniref:hypothetical protein n=1 Tax=Peribacillus sp. CSMR9 TaxID=2981350 RepID=UPI0029543BFF|nr:hypothetical protein [Peribacillus sp. CSMR9]MDV7767593.1 hypothetical protein [Peribacillus sp. CSMR9]